MSIARCVRMGCNGSWDSGHREANPPHMDRSFTRHSSARPPEIGCSSEKWSMTVSPTSRAHSAISSTGGNSISFLPSLHPTHGGEVALRVFIGQLGLRGDLFHVLLRRRDQRHRRRFLKGPAYKPGPSAGQLLPTGGRTKIKRPERSRELRGSVSYHLLFLFFRSSALRTRVRCKLLE